MGEGGVHGFGFIFNISGRMNCCILTCESWGKLLMAYGVTSLIPMDASRRGTSFSLFSFAHLLKMLPEPRRDQSTFLLFSIFCPFPFAFFLPPLLSGRGARRTFGGEGLWVLLFPVYNIYSPLPIGGGSLERLGSALLSAPV